MRERLDFEDEHLDHIVDLGLHDQDLFTALTTSAQTQLPVNGRACSPLPNAFDELLSQNEDSVEAPICFEDRNEGTQCKSRSRVAERKRNSTMLSANTVNKNIIKPVTIATRNFNRSSKANPSETSLSSLPNGQLQQQASSAPLSPLVSSWQRNQPSHGLITCGMGDLPSSTVSGRIHGKRSTSYPCHSPLRPSHFYNLTNTTYAGSEYSPINVRNRANLGIVPASFADTSHSTNMSETTENVSQPLLGDCYKISPPPGVRCVTKVKNPQVILPQGHINQIHGSSSKTKMGCKCKKTTCLQKYCGCFMAGASCGESCKCLECKNVTLIDQRANKKDSKAMAMGERSPGPSRSIVINSKAHGSSSTDYRRSHGFLEQRTDKREYQSASRRVSRSSVLTQGLSFSRELFPQYDATFCGLPSRPYSSTLRKPQRMIALATVVTQSTNKRARQVQLGDQESMTVFAVPKTTALAIFSYLTNSDLYHVSLVSKDWSKMALDKELWY